MQITTEKEEKIKTLIREAESELKEDFAFADAISEYNQEKVIDAFAKNGVALRHFNGSSGYGIGDEGIAPLRAVAFWADSFQRKRKRPKKIRKDFFGR